MWSVATKTSRQYPFNSRIRRLSTSRFPSGDAALKDRIEKLERLVGRLTLENEFLKKGLQNTSSQSRRNGKLSGGGNTSSVVSSGGAGL